VLPPVAVNETNEPAHIVGLEAVATMVGDGLTDIT